MKTEVEVRLSRSGDERTTFELEHSSPAAVVDDLVATYGPGGTIGIGGGWDLTVLGLALHLHGADLDPATWENAPDVQAFAAQACHAWGPAVQKAWNTSDEDIAAAVEFGVQHFAPGSEQS